MKVIAILITSLFATLAFAHDTPKPCKADVEKLCPGVKPGEGRIVACLKEKQNEVSDGCKAKMKEHKAKKEDTPQK